MSKRQDPSSSPEAVDADEGPESPGPFRRSRALRACALALACATALAAIVDANQWARRNPGVDYYQLWLVTRWVEQGGDPHIYGEGNQYRLAEFASAHSLQPRSSSRERTAAAQNLDLYSGRIEPYGSPFLYAWLDAFTTGDYARDIDRFAWATILACAAAIALLCWSFQYSAIIAMLAVAVLTYTFLPLRSLLQVGNVAGIQLLAVALFVALQARRSGPGSDLLSGFFIGLAIAFKPTAAFVLLPAAIVWAIDRNVRKAASIGIACLTAWLLAIAWGGVYFGSAAVWRAWLTDLSGYLQAGPTASSGNCAIPGVIEHSHGINIGLPVLVVLLGLVALAAWRTRARLPAETAVGLPRSRTGSPRTALAAALGGSLGILVSSLAWYHYFVIAVPLILWTWRPQDSDGRRILAYRAVALAALILLSVLPLELGLGRRFVELWLGNAALILLTGLGLLDLAFRPSDSQAGVPDSWSSLRESGKCTATSNATK